MRNKGFNQDYGHTHQLRYEITLNFMDGLIFPKDKILDLGPPNPLGNILQEKNYQIENTPNNTDLNLNNDTD